ncbi:hypothetical protein [Pseudomonas sp. zfem005]|uniref:hypothetical protein n=1 Tax=Pseudomonas sp. zfem005 TaxID=3078200 RepID=UPI00292982B8|nr:hypothetical protein [Pseudomonas sp. zfem005]MDU9413779.1 hypothetical protein [Pseudomonas sp. zfem005]
MALKESGLECQSIGVRGSSITNPSSKCGSFRFDAQDGMKPSDIDVFIDLSKDIAISSSENISGFIHPNKLFKRYPALKAWSDKWSKILGREITPGGFKLGTFTDADMVRF